MLLKTNKRIILRKLNAKPPAVILKRAKVRLSNYYSQTMLWRKILRLRLNKTRKVVKDFFVHRRSRSSIVDFTSKASALNAMKKKSIFFAQQSKSKGSILETNSKNSANIDSAQPQSSKRDTIYSKKNEKQKKVKRNESHGGGNNKSQAPSLFFMHSKESKNSDRYAASAVPQPRIGTNISIKLNDLDEISSIDSDFYDSYE